MNFSSWSHSLSSPCFFPLGLFSLPVSSSSTFSLPHFFLGVYATLILGGTGVVHASTTTHTLTAERVVQSSLKHFPKVIQAVQNLEIEENKLLEARGTFDGQIQGEADSGISGPYGNVYSVSVEKPMPYLNSKIYGGRSQSFQGSKKFPEYEDESTYLINGKNFLGFSLSLLRNSLIDENRYNIWQLEQEREQARINVSGVKINVQTMALKSYWTWVIKGHELGVYKNILNLAKQRARQLKRRIKAGDLAQIYDTENNQYILKRQAQVTSEKNGVSRGQSLPIPLL